MISMLKSKHNHKLRLSLVTYVLITIKVAVVLNSKLTSVRIYILGNWDAYVQYELLNADLEVMQLVSRI